MKETRSKNIAQNITTQALLKILQMALGFLSRTIFIYILGIQYVGINSLFASILSVLSFAELGIGNAVSFALYKPLYEKNYQKIASLMGFFKAAYRLIAGIVFLLGVCLIPWLGYLVTGVPDIKENIVFIYIIFLIKTASSYLLVYKATLLVADQKGYKADKITFAMQLFGTLAELGILIFTKNYLLYLLTDVFLNILQNIMISICSDRTFPQVGRKEKQELLPEEKKSLFSDVKYILMSRIGNITLSTDNIIISLFLGVSMVGKLSNYTIVTEYVRMGISMLYGGILPSVGNVFAGSGFLEEKFDRFQELNMFFSWIGSFSAVSLIVLLNPFIEIWLGEGAKLSFTVVLLLSLNIYLRTCVMPSNIIINSNGLFKDMAWLTLLMGIINITSSYILVRSLGISGVLLGTILCRLLTQIWYMPYLTFKKIFCRNIWPYYLRQIWQAVLFAGISAATYIFGEAVSGEEHLIYGFIVKIVCCLIIPNFILYRLNRNKKEFKIFKNRIRGVLALK